MSIFDVKIDAEKKSILVEVDGQPALTLDIEAADRLAFQIGSAVQELETQETPKQ